MALQNSPGASAGGTIALCLLIACVLTGHFFLALIPAYMAIVMANGIDQGRIDSR